MTFSQEALIIIFKHLKFPDNFINILKCMFLKSKAKVIVNGTLTEEFEIQRGVKQGDPLSPILFSFAIKLLGRAANDPKLNSEMSVINELKITHLMYANDSILISKSDEGIKLWLEKLNLLDKATGLHINEDKTFTINSEIPQLKKLEVVQSFVTLALTSIVVVLLMISNNLMMKWQITYHKKLRMIQTWVVSVIGTCLLAGITRLLS